MAKISKGKKPKLSQTKSATSVKKVISKKPKIEKQPTVPKPESDSEPDPDKLLTLLEPYTKDKIVSLIVDSAVKHPALYDHIQELLDGDVTHRKIFVYGLAWNATQEDVLSTFQPFGDIETCNLVKDRATGNSKGYGFVLFKTRKAALKALKDPQKNIGGRMASCQLASVGPGSAAKAKERNNAGPAPVRKNVGFVDPKGKSQVGAMQGQVQGQQGPVQPHQAQLLAAVAAAQNLALFSQHPGLNAMYGGLLGNSSGAGFMNPALNGALSHGSVGLSHGDFGQAMATTGMATTGTGQLAAMWGNAGSFLGAYGSYGASMGAVPQPNSMQIEHLLSRNKGTRGSFTGATSNMWYELFLLDSMCTITFAFSEVIFPVVVGVVSGLIINTIKFLIEPSFATRKCRRHIVCTSLACGNSSNLSLTLVWKDLTALGASLNDQLHSILSYVKGPYFAFLPIEKAHLPSLFHLCPVFLVPTHCLLFLLVHILSYLTPISYN